MIVIPARAPGGKKKKGFSAFHPTVGLGKFDSETMTVLLIDDDLFIFLLVLE